MTMYLSNPRLGPTGLEPAEFIEPSERMRTMSEHVIPPAEPQPIDEQRSIELRIVSTNAGLKGAPSGAEQCDNCLYYLENTADISYCWHSKLRILVGATWWCQWWEKTPESQST